MSFVAPTNVLVAYTMQGQLLTNSGPNAYEWVYWKVFNTPDLTGAQSGYFGQLQNISIASSETISSPTSGAVTPTSAAGGDLGGYYPNPQLVAIGGIPIVGTPSTGFVLQYNGTSLVWVAPGAAAQPIPVVNSAGGTINIAANTDTWNEGASSGVTPFYQLAADSVTVQHIIGWLSGATPVVLPPAGWTVQSPVDGLPHSRYTYGSGGNPAGERYVWRPIVALLMMVPT